MIFTPRVTVDHNFIIVVDQINPRPGKLHIRSTFMFSELERAKAYSEGRGKEYVGYLKRDVCTFLVASFTAAGACSLLARSYKTQLLYLSRDVGFRQLKTPLKSNIVF